MVLLRKSTCDALAKAVTLMQHYFSLAAQEFLAALIFKTAINVLTCQRAN